MQPPRELLRRIFDAAIAAAQPALRIPPHLRARPRGRLGVIGAGKASAAMVDHACEAARRDGFASAGDAILVSAGMPFGTHGATNLLRIAQV